MKKSKAFEIAAAIVCAVCLWLYVVTVVTPDDNISISDIPVVFQGENELRNEYGLIISNKSASAVTVKFHGSRSDLKRLNANKSSISAVLDVTQFNKEREYSASYDIVLPSALQDKAVDVVDRTPRTVQFTVERLATKQIPVKGVFDGTLAEGYVLGELVFDQDIVKVTGPSALVDKVNYAQVVVGGENLTQSLTKTVGITIIGKEGEPLRSNDLTTSAQEIEVKIPVLLEKVLPLQVTPVYAAGATAENTTISILPEEIKLQGPSNIMEELQAFDLGELDLSKVHDGEEVVLPLQLPEGVTCVSGETDATVKAVFTGIEMMDVTITQMQTINAEQGVTTSVLDPAVTVYLRGPSEELIELDESKLLAVVDLAGYSESGSFTVPVTIQTGSETVGAVGAYTVTVKIKA